MDVLVPNGTPAWYGDSGADHTAAAHTWRHPATSRYGTALVDGYDIAYLPLDDVATGEPTVIDVLREARHTDQRWITIDIDPADRHLIAPGRVAPTAHHDQHVPADATWVQATVTSTAVAGQEYRALVADGYTTDAGYEVARFDRATAERMVADLTAVHANHDRNSDPMPGEYPHLRWAGDVLLLIEERDNVNGNTYREVDQAHPDPQGRYAIGAYGWPWQRVTKWVSGVASNATFDLNGRT